MYRGELDVFKRLFDYARDWEIVLQDVQQEFYLTIQHAPPHNSIWCFGTAMVFVPCYEKSIKHAKSILLVSTSYDVRYKNPLYGNANHDYPKHVLFERHCFVFAKEMTPFKSTTNLLARLGQHFNV